MPRVWVSLGSNVDRRRSIRGAVRALRERYGALVVSRVYESEAVGCEGDPFYNLVAGFDTEASLQTLCAEFRALEDAFGRVRGPDKFAPRTLDLDLLTYGDQVVDQGPCPVPRDEITRYAFVLGPLAEVAGDQRHPLLGCSFRALWERFEKSAQPMHPVPVALD